MPELASGWGLKKSFILLFEVAAATENYKII